jgi:hypothetical protein
MTDYQQFEHFFYRKRLRYRLRNSCRSMTETKYGNKMFSTY